MYNWQHQDWANFIYDDSILDSLVPDFAIEFGELRGMISALPNAARQDTVLELLVNEAIKTSEIEGEFYSRMDVMSSIKNKIGIHPSIAHIRDKEARGIGELMVDVNLHFNTPLSESLIKNWHHILFQKSSSIHAGAYRSGDEAMVIVSGSYGREIIHYEAPPSIEVENQMKKFISWYNNFIVQPNAIKQALIKASLTHLYFESIHPFEDGNGRIGRALSEKCLAECFQYPLVLSISNVIGKNKLAYYDNLKIAQRTLEVTQWIYYFSNLVLSAQKLTKQLIEFTLFKTRFIDLHRSSLNDRQLKVVLKMFEYGLEGFQGGMTAKKYISITKTSKATATRDLQDLLEKRIFSVSGAGRSVSYSICDDAL